MDELDSFVYPVSDTGDAITPSERVQILTAFVPKGPSCVYGHSPELHFIRDPALKALISAQMLQLKSIEDISVACPGRCLTALSYGTYPFVSSWHRIGEHPKYHMNTDIF